MRIRDRRRVHNHLGTVHAIALCNLAELSADVMTDATIPLDMRWIPKGMSSYFHVMPKAKDGYAVRAIRPRPERRGLPRNGSVDYLKRRWAACMAWPRRSTPWLLPPMARSGRWLCRLPMRRAIRCFVHA